MNLRSASLSIRLDDWAGERQCECLWNGTPACFTRDDCLRDDEIIPATAANAAQRIPCNAQAPGDSICIKIFRSWRRRGRCTLHASFGDRRVQNVRSSGRTYYGWPPPSDFKIVASLVPVLLYRPNDGAHSTACVRLSFEVIHFLVIILESDLVQLGTLRFQTLGLLPSLGCGE